MLKEIDQIFLSFIERKVAHPIQRTFGIKPMSIAAVGHTIFACSLISRWFIPEITISTANRVVDVLFVVSIFWLTMVVYPGMERQADQDLSQGLSNRNKVGPLQTSLRLICLFMFLLDLVFLYVVPSMSNLNFALRGFGLVVATYFSACDPLPPGPSSLRMLLVNLFGKTTLAQTGKE